MPTLDVSDLNVTISILGAFIVIFGLISIKVKRSWYLGEARTFLFNLDSPGMATTLTQIPPKSRPSSSE